MTTYRYPYDYDEWVFCPVEDRPHSVYRLYDDANRLLYIGCTRDLDLRLYMHDGYYNTTSLAFRGLVDRVETVEYENRAAARQAEREAIQAESPLFNKAHNQGRQITRDEYDSAYVDRHRRAS
jgi:predicted GIY-YIG superfamily endonuclease